MTGDSIINLQDFGSVFPQLVADLLALCLEEYQLPVRVWNQFEKSLNHNTIGGKCNRGLSVIDSVRLLRDGRVLTQAEYFDAAVLGWLVELLQATMLVLDDIMDESPTRRGKPSWYRITGVGMAAVNDATMLESAIYMLLKKYFAGRAIYLPLVELFHETALQIELGQALDMLMANEGSPDFKTFISTTYSQIVTYKTAFYSFYLPVALALYAVDAATPANLTAARAILVSMGEYFQVQDDYLDCFADPTVLGKVGTDIVDGKCSWLAVQALQRASTDQAQLLAEKYGSPDGESAVKGLYRELGLEAEYRRFEEQRVVELRNMIAALDESQGLRKSVFEELLGKIYQRRK
ncbi:ERG20 farnesyl diphosphate synthase [Penicillium fimorum]|uniref:ERG20 farnesyl diphosphate synthase n=1 Tax=Penicillium fimorum TaxID=1882269 RepID=A0A9W9XQA1_9EURO|nr:ERG20 farnesyl diphosphate synthase [Penicillium fimorum]